MLIVQQFWMAMASPAFPGPTSTVGVPFSIESTGSVGTEADFSRSVGLPLSATTSVPYTIREA